MDASHDNRAEVLDLSFQFWNLTAKPDRAVQFLSSLSGVTGAGVQ
jgi:hypothetical protein